MPDAFRRFCEAALQLREQRGSEAYLDLLHQEVVREEVAVRLASQKREAFAKTQTAQALAALEFYADCDNYKSRHGQPSEITKDNGRIAREAMGDMPEDEG